MIGEEQRCSLTSAVFLIKEAQQRQISVVAKVTNADASCCWAEEQHLFFGCETVEMLWAE